LLEVPPQDPLTPAAASVLVTGAGGFVGRNLCRALLASGREVVGLIRAVPSPGSQIEGVRYVNGDITRPESLSPDLFDDCSAVVHLVGIIAEQRGAGQTFERVHVRGTANLLKAARSSGRIERFIYLSALGASPSSRSEYARSKARAEKLVAQSGIAGIVLRPSVILGPGAEFIAQIEGLIQRPPLSPFPLPFVPVPGSGQNLFQPLFVDDLTRALIVGLDDDKTTGQIIEIGGADRVSFDQLIQAFQTRLGTAKMLIHVPIPVLMVAAAFLESLLPRPPVTLDQLIQLKIDNVCDNGPATQLLGFEPRSFVEMLSKIPRGKRFSDTAN
jgi:nucleoside-diphosphate-sugar epimerase